MVHTLAKEVMALNQQVNELDKLIEARFRDHDPFAVITSMPGLGVILGAESWPPLAATWPSSKPRPPRRIRRRRTRPPRLRQDQR